MPKKTSAAKRKQVREERKIQQVEPAVEEVQPATVIHNISSSSSVAINDTEMEEEKQVFEVAELANEEPDEVPT